MVVETLPADIMSLVFLVAVTVIMWLGYAKEIMLIQLAAICVLLFGSVWVMQNANPMLALLFVLVNVILFALGMMRR